MLQIDNKIIRECEKHAKVSEWLQVLELNELRTNRLNDLQTIVNRITNDTTLTASLDFTEYTYTELINKIKTEYNHTPTETPELECQYNTTRTAYINRTEGLQEYMLKLIHKNKKIRRF